MNASFTRPAWMISRAMAFASEMSEPTSMPSHASAHCAVVVRRGSTAYMPGAVPDALQHVVEEDRVRFARVRAPQDDQVGVFRLPVGAGAATAPNTAARPTTLGACQVRLQLSMLLLPITARVNFWAM